MTFFGGLFAYLLLLFTVGAAPLTAQHFRVPQAVDEYIGGAAGNAVLRGPWIAPAFRQPMPRLVVFTAASGLYEWLVDNHHRGNTAQAWIDFGQREVGYLGSEVLVAILRRRW
jgi:hypothetical protein